MSLDLEQGWLRLLAESRRNPFQQAGPLFFEANLPMLTYPRRVDTSQGPLARPRCCPALDDWVLLQALVAALPPANTPKPQRRGRLWVYAGFNDLWRQLDRRLLVQCFQGQLRSQFEAWGGPCARGLPLLGKVSLELAALYLQPLTGRLQSSGWHFQLDGYQGIHFWVDTPRESEQALDQTLSLLEPLALGLDFQRTFVVTRWRDRWQKLRSRFRLEYLCYRLGLADWAQVWRSHAYLYRRPPLAGRLGWSRVQAALARCLRHPDSRPGDRALWLLYLVHSGQPVLGPLREALGTLEDWLQPLVRRALD